MKLNRRTLFAPLVLLFLAIAAFGQTPKNEWRLPPPYTIQAPSAAELFLPPHNGTGWKFDSIFQAPRSDIITLQNAAAADGNGTAFDVGTYGGVAVQITGSFTATITFEATIDRSNWVAIKADNLNDRTSATTATAAGIFQVPLSGAVQFRARISDYSGGTVTVKARGVAGQISLKQSSGGGGGGAVDSVFGRTGDVVAANNDYLWSQINKGTSSIADITTRSASDLSSGTLPDGRFPATLPAASGANLTALNGSNIASGTVAAARGGAGTVNGIMKANGSGVVSAAVSSTDYAPATSGSSILKGNGSGGFSNAASGTDYAPATSGSAVLKGNGSGGFSAAVADTDYQQPLTFTAGVARVTNAISLDVNNANTWTANQTFGSGIARMTSPRITTSIFDANGLPIISLNPTASAVNSLQVTNGATGSPGIVDLAGVGSDSNIRLSFTSKGTGGAVFTNASANGLVVGPNGATNPVLKVVTNVSSQASGISVTGNADGTAPSVVVNSRTQQTASIAGNGLAITADPAIAGSSSAGAAAGGSITITAGDAARLTSGNANGGDIVLATGAGIGTGTAGQVLAPSGVAGAPGYSFSAKANTGLYYATNQVFVSANGSVGLTIGSADVYSGSSLRAATTVGVPSTGTIGFGSSGSALSSIDTFLRRAAAANLAHGAADAASPTRQIDSVQNVSSGTSNTAGAHRDFYGSQSTGNAVGGDINFWTSPAGGSGTSVNTLVTAFTVKGDGAVQLKSVTFTNLPTVANGYLIYCSDCTIASPCASGGSGALAKGINGAWVCN